LVDDAIVQITHGGQLGAPFSQGDCGAVLGNPCIRGQWEHQRHYVGKGNPRSIVDIDNNFHSLNPNGVERAAGTFRESVTFTDTAPRSCDTNDQNFTATTT